MVYIVTLLSSLNLLIAATRLRMAFFVFVALLPFMPRYLGISIGSGSLSARRIILAQMVLFFMIWVSFKHNLPKMVGIIRNFAGLFVALALLFLVKSVSTLQEGQLSNLIYVVDDFLFSVPVVLITMMLINTEERRERLLFIVIVGLLFSELLSLVEYIRQAPILKGIVDIEVAVRETVKEGRFRDGVYRAAALFDNPLLLSEFTCISWPFSWHAYHNTKSRSLRRIALLSLLLVPMTLFFVNARSGWLVFALTILFMIFITSWRRLDKLLKLIIGAGIVVVLAVMFYWLIDIFQSPTHYFSRNDQGGLSAIERISQYSVVTRAFFEHPLLGFGAQQNFSNDLSFLNKLDNYWLRLILEGGLLDVMAFATFTVLVLRNAFRMKALVNTTHEKRFFVALISSLSAFIAYKIFLSMPWNNIYLFIMAGMIAGWNIEEAIKS
jgi:hypothetical protein